MAVMDSDTDLDAGMEITVVAEGSSLESDQEAHIRRLLVKLGKRLAHFPEPSAHVVLKQQHGQQRVDVALRVELGPLGNHLISHQWGKTDDHAVRLAIADVERQLERRLAKQRGEHTFGVPSRREPASLRPHPPGEEEAAGGEEQ
jgi:hypothetical protein